jgi:hypothetical protein
MALFGMRSRRALVFRWIWSVKQTLFSGNEGSTRQRTFLTDFNRENETPRP